MRKSMTRIALASAAVVCSFTAAALEPISKLEALHLVEAKARGFSVQSIESREDGNTALYTITGVYEDQTAQAVVDADAARVLRIAGDSETFYEWPGIIVVGHRATVKFAPENTLPAIREAIRYGADLLELDIRQTKDGEYVLMHDVTVNRTTDGSGRIDQMTMDEVRKLDAGSWMDDAMAGTRVPTLKEALAEMKGKALPDIDFKGGDPAGLVKVIRDAGFDQPLTFYCGSWDLMRAVRDEDRNFLFRPTIPEYGAPGLTILIQELDPPVVNINWPHVTPEMVRQVHLADKLAFINTMGASDHEAGIRLAVETGADYIQSDHLDILVRVLEETGMR
jgi:glycerophosphoryl diester phosphodiesterase